MLQVVGVSQGIACPWTRGQGALRCAERVSVSEVRSTPVYGANDGLTIRDRCSLLNMLESLGVRVVEVDGLPQQAAWVPACRVLLIRPGVGPEVLIRAVDRVLLS